MKPALTDEEWKVKAKHWPAWALHGERGIHAELVDEVNNFYLLRLSDTGEKPCEIGAAEDGRHAIAALALYGQPFGFTQQDVRMLRLVAEGSNEVDTNYGAFPDMCASLADRIAALLPPEP